MASTTHLHVSDEPVPHAKGMDVIETGAEYPQADGSSVVVKMRLDFPEGHGMKAIDFLQRIQDELTEVAIQLAARGDASAVAWAEKTIQEAKEA